jgi:uncharacterized Fe-S cluster protein YjdI
MKNLSLLLLSLFAVSHADNAVEVECAECHKSPTTNAPVAASTQKPSPVTNSGIQNAYGQCGGIGWTGPTQCCAGYNCVKGNDYYWQCVPAPTAAASQPPVAASTQKPTPAATSGIQNAYGQCGGIGWTGPTQCASGYNCVKGNEWYFQCVPVPTAGTSARPSPVVDTGVQCGYEQCGGIGWNGPTKCELGWTCSRCNDYYSQCVPAPTVAVTQAPVANTGIQNAYGQCGGIGWTGPTQCVSGYNCVKGNDWYFQCVPVPTAATSARPSPAADTGVQCGYEQCGGIGWNGPTKCEAGWTCSKCNDYYSQCVPVPTVAVTQAPVPNAGIQNAYGQCGGIGWTGPTQCVSGYNCVKGNDWYFQCVPVPTAATSARPSPVANTGVQCGYGQCGGDGWSGPTKCESGWTCSKCNDHYSQCVPRVAIIGGIPSLRGNSEDHAHFDV